VDLTPLIIAASKSENIAIIVLLLVCAGLLKTITVIRKEDRESRTEQEARNVAAQERNNIVLEKVAEALTQIRIALASKGIRSDDHV
jgi:hypothetical protein